MSGATWVQELRAGDVLLLRRVDPLSQLIRYVDDLDDPSRPGQPHRRHVDASHAALYLGIEDERPLAMSVWPMPDRPEEGDVVLAELDELLPVYSGVVALRHRHVSGLDRSAWEDGAFPPLRAEVGALREEARRPGASDLRFDDVRMVAAGLASSWRDIGDELVAGLPWIQREVLDRLVDEFVDNATRRPGLVCPDLLVSLYGSLGAEFELLPGGNPIATRRTVAPSEARIGPAVGRAVLVLVSLLLLDRLVAAEDDGIPGRALLQGLSRPEPVGVRNPLVTPGQIARSDRLEPVLAVTAYRDVVARGDAVWDLPRARDVVRQELRWSPGVKPSTDRSTR